MTMEKLSNASVVLWIDNIIMGIQEDGINIKSTSYYISWFLLQNVLAGERCIVKGKNSKNLHR